MELDAKDRKILHQLDIDARQPFSQIAKKTRLSKSVVEYRIKKLTKKGIIRSFYTLINTSRLGLIHFRLFIRFRNMTEEKEEEMLRYLQDDENVGWIVKTDGNWDISFRIEAKNIYEFKQWTAKLHTRFSEYIDEERTFIFTYAELWNKEYLLKKNIREKTIAHYQIIPPAGIKLDKDDVTILDMLQKDCRISVIELASATGLTAKTVSKKIRHLLDNQIISSFRILIDLFALGYEYYQVLFNLMNPRTEERLSLITFLKRNPYITFYEEVIGGADFEIELQVESAAHFRKIMTDIKHKFGRIIRNYEYLNYYKEYEVTPTTKQRLLGVACPE